MYTFGQLKSDIRKRVFPAGEASNLVASHDKMFIDAMMDLQTWVKCLQYDHTDLVPQCATLYNCGLTVFDAPRGSILKVSVVDRIDPTTGAESAEAECGVVECGNSIGGEGIFRAEIGCDGSAHVAAKWPALAARSVSLAKDPG